LDRWQRDYTHRRLVLCRSVWISLSPERAELALSNSPQSANTDGANTKKPQVEAQIRLANVSPVQSTDHAAEMKSCFAFGEYNDRRNQRCEAKVGLGCKIRRGQEFVAILSRATASLWGFLNA
jgi:hypothetical protein